MKTMHLFAGAGGGLLGDLILGHEPIVAVEWDGYCCNVLRERAADGWFPGLHVWEGDVRLFDPSEYAGKVDCIHAGFPCQDLSVAGNQAGLGADTRSGLYREVLRIAGVVRPRYLFLENVAAILSVRQKITLIVLEKVKQIVDFLGKENNESHAGRYTRHIIQATGQSALGTVLGDLAAHGYDCRWCCLEASGVGAPHKRDRWWLLGTLANPSIGRCGKPEKREIQQSGRTETIGAGDDVSDSTGKRWNEARRDCKRSTERIAGSGDSLADASCKLPHGGRNTWIRCAELADGNTDVPDAIINGLQGQSITEPSECESIREFSGREVAGNDNCSRADGSGRNAKSELGGMADGLAFGAHKTEKRDDGMGVSQGWWKAEPDIGRVAVGIKNRGARLKAIGNGQVALQMAVAWRILGGE